MALLLTSTLLGTVVLASVATADGSNVGSPSERDPYCELQRNGSSRNYNGIGWYPEVIKPDSPVGPFKLTACEGEHWDGDDTVQPKENGGGTCTSNVVDLSQDSYALAYRQCPESASQPKGDVLNPVGVRVAARGDKGSLDHGAMFVTVRIFNVGVASLFAGGCLNTLNGGTTSFGHFDGARNCQGGMGHGVLGVYLQDDMSTPIPDGLASIVTLARLTKGYVENSDCTQAEYDRSAYEVWQGRKATCGRDNTAITIELLA